MKLRYFAGLRIEEAAAALAISDRTAKRTGSTPAHGCWMRFAGREALPA